MKVLKSQIMKKLLKRGEQRTKGKRPPNEGMMQSLFTHETKNGWYYQVDWINDLRMNEKPFVSVHAFKPPRVFHAKSAEYVLTNV